jgi:hypothetical protein
MSNHTLILNNDFTPLSVIPISSVSWREAVRMSYLDQCNTLEYYHDWEVHSPTITMAVPSVMISRTFVKKKHVVRFTRNNLLIRDNFQCQYCGIAMTNSTLTVDHVIPRVRGGKTKWENIVCACHRCNANKGHKTHIRPMQMPYRPSYFQLLGNARKMQITVPDAVWIDYLGWDPNLVRVQPPNKQHI